MPQRCQQHAVSVYDSRRAATADGGPLAELHLRKPGSQFAVRFAERWTVMDEKYANGRHLTPTDTNPVGF